MRNGIAVVATLRLAHDWNDHTNTTLFLLPEAVGFGSVVKVFGGAAVSLEGVTVILVFGGSTPEFFICALGDLVVWGIPLAFALAWFVFDPG